MTSPTERLDDPEIERRIEAIRRQTIHWNQCPEVVGHAGCHCGLTEKFDALRSRIRTLIEEARKEGRATCEPRPGKLPEPEWDY